MEGMLDTGPGTGAQAVDELLILGQRPSVGAAPIDAVADAGSLGTLAMRLIPVGLIAEHLSLLPVRQLGDLRAVVHIRRGGAQAVYNAAPTGAQRIADEPLTASSYVSAPQPTARRRIPLRQVASSYLTRTAISSR